MSQTPEAAPVAAHQIGAFPVAGKGARPGFGVERRAVNRRKEKGIKQLADGRWRFSWVHKGKYHRKTAPSYAIAAASLAKIRASIAEGKYLEKEVGSETTFESAVKEFRKWGKNNLRPGTTSRDGHFTAYWLQYPRFKGKALSGITVQDCEAYRSKRAEEVGKRTCDYDLSRLRRLFALAIEWGLCEKNPAKGVKFYNPESRRSRFLTFEEEEQILAGSPEFLRPAIVFSLHTGVRIGELVSLTWGQVDLERRTITITAEKAKGKRTRHIPLNDIAYKAIGTQPRGIAPTAPVFPQVVEKTNFYFSRRLRQIAKAAGVDLKELCWHTLRHTFASRLVQAGVSLQVVKELLGHTTLVMVMRYAHLADKNLRAGVDVLAEVSELQKSCTRSEEGS